jgi:hypothetical protein
LKGHASWNIRNSQLRLWTLQIIFNNEDKFAEFIARVAAYGISNDLKRNAAH